MSRLQKCRQKRPDCFAYTPEGFCNCLSDTRFKGKCPFYKNNHDVKEFKPLKN